jgi:hypothetical protein
VLFQPLRMLSDKPPQTTSTGRDERSSTRYSHYMLKVTSARLASVVRENMRQDASRLIIRQQTMLQPTGCEFAGVC